jgi:hypothetical protein
MPRGVRTVSDDNLLSAALEGLEAQKARIEEQIRQVRAMLGRRGPGRREAAAAAPAERPAPAGGRRQLSPAARKRIAAAQKRRWAEYRKKTAKASAKAAAGKEKE